MTGTDIKLVTEPDVNTSRKGPVIAGIIAFLLLFGAGGTWLAMANIAGAVVATGAVAVQGHSKTVQHPEGGVVAAINVADGDIVMQLDSRLLLANLNVYSNRLQEAIATKNRLIAERDEKSTIISSDAALITLGLRSEPDVEAAQAKLFEARLRTRQGQKTQILEQIEQFKNQIAGIEAQEASLQERIILLDEQTEGAKQLLAQGFGTETAVRDLKRQRAELDGQLGEVIASKAQAENSINEAEIRVLQGRANSCRVFWANLPRPILKSGT